MRTIRAVLVLFLFLIPASTPASTLEILAGLEDDFAPGPDLVHPSPELTALLAPFYGTQDFDLTVGLNEGVQNRQVAHTFSNLPTDITAATLEVRVYGGHNNGVASDGIFFSFADGTILEYEDAIVYRRSFGPMPAVLPFYPEADPGLVGPTWDREVTAVFVFDLDAMPLPDGSTMSLLRGLNHHGLLDVCVSDETAADYMRLTVTGSSTGIEPLSGVGDLVLTSTPNPFRSFTTIRFSTIVTGRTSVRIFDVTGRLVRTLADRRLAGGDHALEWNGRDEQGLSVPSGVYFYRLDSGRHSETERIVRIK